MVLKRIITGALTAIIITGMCISAFSAEEKKVEEKKVNYQTYAAELDKTSYSGDDLGAVWSEKSTTFKVWAPKASSVKLNLYEHGSDEEGEAGSIATKTMELDKKTGVWSVTVDGDIAGKYYTYSVKNGDNVTETGDVYAKACGVNGKRSMVVNLGSTNPDGWDRDVHVTVSNPTEASVWEVSVADFSSSESSGVSSEHRGKFLAFTEEGTTVDGIQGGTSTCVDYLKRLGIKYVQIMPFYDFGSVDESKDIMSQYNWGYDPVNYNCPEGSYSTNPYDGNVRIKECKQMIQALHNAGIGVIMDVVYNHTYSTDSVFQNTVPNYYYRMNEDGTFSNGSGCSNDTASEHKMFRKYMIDSVTYWAKEYHIDGFRFDLMGLHDVETLNQIRAALDNLYDNGIGKKIIMYGEAWNMPTAADEGTVMANQSNLKQLDSRIGAFDDTIRDAIKGSTGGTDKAFIQEGSRKADLKTGVSGQSNHTSGWANVTSQCVTYASCHDNLCLYDKLVDSVYGRDSEYRKRYEDLVAMNKLSAAIVMTSQGIPFMYAGEEFARSKDGDENSFSSSREENMLDWNNVNKYSDIVEYYRGLMQIREEFAAFKDSTDKSANAINYLSDLPKTVVGYTLENTEQGKWNKVCVLFNGGDEAQTIKVDGEWVIVADNETAGLRNLGTASGSVEVKAHSAVVMADKAGFDNAALTIREGVVVANYYDNQTQELISTQTITGGIGKAYNLADNAFFLNYDVKKTGGDAEGFFTDGVLHAKLYVEKYEGKFTTVNFHFVDAESGEDLIDFYSIKNRTGVEYYTPEIPGIENYRLVLDELPSNASGVLPDKDFDVIFKYSKLADDDKTKDECRVNVIYMDGSGKVLDKITLTGAEGEDYSASEKEYEDMTLRFVPSNANGSFGKTEINVIFSYTNEPDPLKSVAVWIFAAAGVILAACVASVVYSNSKRKKKFAESMDIDE